MWDGANSDVTTLHFAEIYNQIWKNRKREKWASITSTAKAKAKAKVEDYPPVRESNSIKNYEQEIIET